MKKELTKEEYAFIGESNKIENVHDGDSYAQAVEAWRFLKPKKELTPGVILKLHKILMLNQPLQPDEKGYLRKCSVFVGSRSGMDWRDIPVALNQWVLNANDLVLNGKSEHEIFKEQKVKQHHVNYESIHPFVDGNGRTGRMLMNWERLKLGMPILVIHEGEEQMLYYEWFREEENDIDPFDLVRQREEDKL